MYIKLFSFKIGHMLEIVVCITNVAIFFISYLQVHSHHKVNGEDEKLLKIIK